MRVHPTLAVTVITTFNQYARQRPDRDVLEDLVQQSYLRLCENNYQNLRRLLPLDEVAQLAYIRRIAANLTIDHLRREKHPVEPLDQLMAARSLDDLDRNALISNIDRLLTACSPEETARDRRIFWLYFRSGLTAKAIAAIQQLGLTQKGVEACLFRLIRCVRRAMVEGIRPAPTFHTGGSSSGTPI